MTHIDTKNETYQNEHFEIVRIPQGLWKMPGSIDKASDYDGDRYHIIPVSPEARAWITAMHEHRCNATNAPAYPGAVQRNPDAQSELGIRISDGFFSHRYFDPQSGNCFHEESGNYLKKALTDITEGLKKVMADPATQSLFE